MLDREVLFEILLHSARKVLGLLINQNDYSTNTETDMLEFVVSWE
jgi:hypothetical protein